VNPDFYLNVLSKERTGNTNNNSDGIDMGALCAVTG